MKVLILAAGQGKRMKSRVPKVVHRILDKPMINWVIDTAKKLSNEIAVVLGNGIDVVQSFLSNDIKIFEQKERLGTGHAVMCAKDFLTDYDVLILYGDVPYISESTLKSLLKMHTESKNDATILTVELENPTGYGRIIKKNNKLLKIIEEQDASPEIKIIKEVYTGIGVFNSQKLKNALEKLTPNNAQGEYYLTEVFQYFENVGILKTENKIEVCGVNDRVQLAELEKSIRKDILRNFMLNGVTIVDPDSTYISPDVEIGIDTVIYPQTFVYGKTKIGENCEIGPLTRIKECIIGNNVKITRSECELTQVMDNVSVGPFSRLREGTFLEENVKIGNFVETKKTHVSKGSKAQHLTYLGDTYIGKDVNIGAGTITCNYDGKKKNKTYIDDDSFIGSNSSLVAPVKIGKSVVIGAGSVITQDVPDFSLALGRAKQINKLNWVKEKRSDSKKGE